MASTGYVASLFTAGEQPTTALWNQLWENDASFNSGAGFNDGIIISRHLATGVQVANKETNPVKFRYYRAGAWTANTGGGAPLAMDTMVYDTGGNYSMTTGLFTAPAVGYYILGGTVLYVGTSNSVVITGLSVNTTGESYRWQELDSISANVTQTGVSEIFMNAGDTASLFCRASNGSGGVGNGYCNFWGSLRSAG